MIIKSFQSRLGKEKIEFLSLGLRINSQKLERVFYFLLLTFLPTQLGLHFWPGFSFIKGIRIDYLSPTLFFNDLLISSICLLFLYNNRGKINLLPNFIKKYSPFFIFLGYLVFNLFLSKNFNLSLLSFIRFMEFSFIAFYTFYNFRKFKKIFYSFARTDYL